MACPISCLAVEKNIPIPSQVGILIQTGRDALHDAGEVKLTHIICLPFLDFCTRSQTQLTDFRVIGSVVGLEQWNTP